MKMETLAVHAGAAADPVTGSVAPPLHLSTTFLHGPATEELHGYTYVRDKNPTQDRLETAMSALEGGEDALVFSSGMGATAAFFQGLEPGSHVIIPEDVYVHVRHVTAKYFANWQLEYSTVDTESTAAIAAALRPNTKAIWAETPSNPQMKIMDIAAAAKIAHEAGAWLVVDNTFATPALQRPLELGADVVMHSTTKYCGGHSDVQGRMPGVQGAQTVIRETAFGAHGAGSGVFALQFLADIARSAHAAVPHGAALSKCDGGGEGGGPVHAGGACFLSRADVASRA